MNYTVKAGKVEDEKQLKTELKKALVGWLGMKSIRITSITWSDSEGGWIVVYEEV